MQPYSPPPPRSPIIDPNAVDTRPIDYRAFLESTPLVPWVADAQTWEFTYVGPQAVALLGFPVEDWYDPAFWTDRIHPADRAHAVATCTTLSEEGGSFEFAYRMIRSDGEVIWVNDTVSVEMGDAGPATLRGFLIDITEQKTLSEAVELAYERVEKLLQDAPDALLSVRSDGTIARANQAARDMFGFSEEELLGFPVERLIPERFGWSHVRHRAGFAKHPTSRHMGKRLDLLARKRDGSEFPVEVSLNPFEDQGGSHVIAAVRDVSDRRHVEAELRASERLLRQMVNSLPVLMAFADADQRYRFVNTNYGEWFDLDPTQMVGRTAREVMGDEAYALARPGIEAVLRGENQRSEMVFPARDGTPKPVEVSHVPQFDDDGVVVGYFVIVSDISDRVNAQAADREHRETLAHFSRVATMGELAASIAHELNQPLAAITANAQAATRFLAMPRPDIQEVADALGDIAGDAKRAANVIRHMRDLLRKGARREDAVDVVSLITETVDMLRSDAIARNCSVAVECPDDVPLLSGDPIQLKQVVLNLMMNAFEAVSDGNGDPGALVITASSSDHRVEISVSDNGPGFSPDLEKDAFAAFVSTKRDGLGMGLSISRSIVEAHGGKLVAETNPEGGATLRVLLPVPAGEEG